MISPENSVRSNRSDVYPLSVIILVLWSAFSLFPLESIAQKTPYTDPLDVKVSPEFSEIAQALEIDHYNLALELLSKLRSDVAKVKDDSLHQEVLAATKEVKRLKREFAKIRNFSEIVKKKTDDPQAHKKVGNFYCAEKGDWGKGLLLLSQTDDPDLKQTASNDLDQPESPSEQGKLADVWWELAKKARGRVRKAYQLRGRYWYLKARPKLSLVEQVNREEQLRQIVLEADKIVIWNMHGVTLDHGTVECVVTLFNKGKSVWRQAVAVPWKANAPAGTVLRPPHVRFDQIRVDITKYRGYGGGLGEIEVFDRNINVAQNCSAIAKSYWRSKPNHHPNNVTDGDKSGVSGLWLLEDHQKGWVLVDMIKFLKQD